MGKSGKSQTTLDGYARTPGPSGSRPATRDSRSSGSQPETVEQETAIPATIQQMFRELRQGIDAINTKLDDQANKMAGMQVAIDGLKPQMQEATQRIGVLEATVGTMQDRLQTNEDRLLALRAKTADLEGRSRRNNIRIVGLPEAVGPARLEIFLESFLKDLLGDPPVSPFYQIERAHRSLAPRPMPGAPPRPIIARLLNYRDRDILLQTARQKGTLKYEQAVIMLFPDYTLEVQGARRAFDAVKQVLRQKQIPYSILFPAKLRIQWQNKAYFFDTPLLATAFVREKLGVDMQDPEGGEDEPQGGWRLPRRRRPGRNGRGGSRLRQRNWTGTQPGEQPAVLHMEEQVEPEQMIAD